MAIAAGPATPGSEDPFAGTLTGLVPTPALTAVDLALAYGPVVAVEGVTVSLAAGTTTALIGPNGSGKSTLLRAVAGLLDPVGGTLDVPAQRVRGGVAFVLQTTDVDRSLPLTVTEAVRLARYATLGPFRRLGRADRTLVRDALDRLDLGSLSRRQLHELSGGQRQRVLVAQGLAQGSELLLLDEPFTGLDLPSRDRIVEVIAEERAAGRTVILSTHDLDDARRCDQVLLLATRQVACGPPGDVLQAGPLGEAYGARMVRIGDAPILLDDPHHGH